VKELTEYDLHYDHHEFAESTYSRFPGLTQQPSFSIRSSAVSLLARTWATEPGMIDTLKSLAGSMDSVTAQVAIEELSRRWLDRHAAFEYLVSLTGKEQLETVRRFAWQEITETWKHIESVPALVHRAAAEDPEPEISAVFLNFLVTAGPRLPETRQYLRFCTRFSDSLE
jgi:hypothetical protein